MGNYIYPFLVAMVVSFLATPLARALAIRFGAVDIPKDNRRVHKEPMPYFGGLAIYLGFLVALFIYVPLNKEVASILLGGTVILIGGLIDDMKDLSPKKKILFQLMAGFILILGGVKIDFITNPLFGAETLIDLGWLSVPVTLFWVVGITNTVNLIDGLDGLAAGVAMISSFSLMLVAGKLGSLETVLLAGILSGSCLGFLPFNFNPAKIFMGDAGALFLGFMLAAISIEGVLKSAATIAIVVPVLILSIPIFDTTFAIFRRLLNGQSVMAADKGHLHHRLLDKGLTQRKTVLILYGVSAVFGSFAVLVAKANSKQSLYLSIGLFVLTVLGAARVGIFEKRD